MKCGRCRSATGGRSRRIFPRRDRLRVRRAPDEDEGLLDAEELKRVYYAGRSAGERKSRALRRLVFDHTLRSGDEAEREAKLVREPVINVHNDYTSGPGRSACATCCPEAEACCKKALRHHPGVARDQSTDPVETRSPSRPPGASPRDLIAPSAAIRTRGETYRVATTRITAGSISPDAARRGARVQGVRIGEGR